MSLLKVARERVTLHNQEIHVHMEVAEQVAKGLASETTTSVEEGTGSAH